MRAFITALLAVSAGFLYAQDVTVKGKTKLNTDFSKYKTFGWAELDPTAQAVGGYEIYTYSEERVTPKTRTPKKTVKSKPGDRYIYSYNVIIPSSAAPVNNAIKSSIADEMEARGYREQPASPDLIVAYRVLERQAKMKGYINDYPTMVGDQEVRQPSDTTTFVLEPGTLLISLIDAKTSSVVWDGFASGLVQDNVFTSDEIKVKEAVHLIMEKFEYRGDKLKVGN